MGEGHRAEKNIVGEGDNGGRRQSGKEIVGERDIGKKGIVGDRDSGGRK